VTILKGHTGIVTNLTWTQQTLVSSSTDGTVKLWQIDPGFADDLLGTLVKQSCDWLSEYLHNNPLINQNDADIRDLCRL